MTSPNAPLPAGTLCTLAGAKIATYRTVAELEAWRRTTPDVDLRRVLTAAIIDGPGSQSWDDALIALELRRLDDETPRADQRPGLLSNIWSHAWRIAVGIVLGLVIGVALAAAIARWL